MMKDITITISNKLCSATERCWCMVGGKMNFLPAFWCANFWISWSANVSMEPKRNRLELAFWIPACFQLCADVKCNSIYLWKVKKHEWETTKYIRPRVRKKRYLRQRWEKTNCLWYGISLICKHKHAVCIFGAAELYSAQCTPGGFRLD